MYVLCVPHISQQNTTVWKETRRAGLHSVAVVARPVPVPRAASCREIREVIQEISALAAAAFAAVATAAPAAAVTAAATLKQTMTRGGGVVVNQREGESTYHKAGSKIPMTKCTKEIGYLIFQSKTLCVELEKMPLITFWSKCLGNDAVWIGLFLSLWLRPFFLQLGKSEKKERI
jgi:hypothetical protein